MVPTTDLDTRWRDLFQRGMRFVELFGLERSKYEAASGLGFSESVGIMALIRIEEHLVAAGRDFVFFQSLHQFLAI